MWGPLGDPLSPLAPVSYKVHWTRGPRQLPGSSPQSIRTLPKTNGKMSGCLQPDLSECLALI